MERLVRESDENIRERVRLALVPPAGQREPTSSRAAATTIIPTKRTAQALGVVIDLWRTQRGWEPLDDDSHDAALVSFFVVLEAADVPAHHYLALYQRAVAARVAALARGENPGPLSGEQMAAEWPGLRAELERAAVSSRKFIAAKARPDCPDCFGSGKKYARVNERGELDPAGDLKVTGEKCECRAIQV